MRIEAAAALASLLLAGNAFAIEPWADADPEKLPERHEIGGIGVTADAEYRAQFIYVDPLSLTTEDQTRFNVMEHRLRIGGTIDYAEKVKLTTSLDLLDGVLFGDNGAFGGTPAADSGLKVTIRSPNNTKACVLARPGADPLDPNSYGWGLCEASPVKVRRLFAQVNTPVGALRIGRQPMSFGMGIQNTDGDGRRNRFGVAYTGDSVDRIIAPVMAAHPGTSPELMVISIGCGSLFLSHLNDSGFWMVKECLGLTVGQTLRTWTITETLIGFSGLGMALLAEQVLKFFN